MLEAVLTIHNRRIIHGDLKPSHFLMVKGILKLIDFGIAKVIRGDATSTEFDSARFDIIPIQGARAHHQRNE
jgi:serine/threonine protein kinase